MGQEPLFEYYGIQLTETEVIYCDEFDDVLYTTIDEPEQETEH